MVWIFFEIAYLKARQHTLKTMYSKVGFARLNIKPLFLSFTTYKFLSMWRFQPNSNREDTVEKTTITMERLWTRADMAARNALSLQNTRAEILNFRSWEKRIAALKYHRTKDGFRRNDPSILWMLAPPEYFFVCKIRRILLMVS